MIQTTAASGILDAFQMKGVDPGAVLRSVGLSVPDLLQPDRYLPLNLWCDLWEAAVRHTRDDAFGLHVGERFHTSEAGILGYVMLHSPTIRDAIHNHQKYFAAHQRDTMVSFHIDDDIAWIDYSLNSSSIGDPRQDAEHTMAILVNFIRIATGRRWSPLEVHFQHARPRFTGSHARVFNSPTYFGARHNMLVLDKDVLSCRVRGADPRLFPILERHVQGLMADLPHENDLIGRVRHLVRQSLLNGVPGVADIARQMALSSRTLQRRLQECHVSFAEIIDDVRRELAERQVAAGSMAFSEIAFELGYSDASAFNRAFRRWTGATPQSYRIAHRR